MRTNPAFNQPTRTALATFALITAVAAPFPAAGQAMVKPLPEDPVASFEKLLPPVAAVPWLEARWRASQKNAAAPRDAASLGALLFTLRPVKEWPADGVRAASASHDVAGM
jgi:hypothetical protein